MSLLLSIPFLFALTGVGGFGAGYFYGTQPSIEVKQVVENKYIEPILKSKELLTEIKNGFNLKHIDSPKQPFVWSYHDQLLKDINGNPQKQLKKIHPEQQRPSKSNPFLDELTNKLKETKLKQS